MHTEKGEDQIPQHASLVTKQKKMVIGSSSSLHKKHLFGKVHLLFSWLVVKILFQDASQAKKLNLTGAQDLKIMHQGKGSLEALMQER